jgi:hypothetical protein
MKVAYDFSTSGHTASHKLGQDHLPQLVKGQPVRKPRGR